MSQNNTINKLIGKLVIKGSITVETGLAIGGNKSGIDIGALDNPVIKYKKGNNDFPYIPGSSLKGKLRALLAKVAGTKDENADKILMNDETNEFKHLAKIFGFAPEKGDNNGEALLKFRDCFLRDENTEFILTEEKMENSINRMTGKANPRPLERVVPQTVFNIDLCLDVYKKEDAEEHLKLIDLAFELLNQDYLGGGGTRGNGRVNLKAKIGAYYNINTVTKVLEVEESNFKFEFTSKYEED